MDDIEGVLTELADTINRQAELAVEQDRSVARACTAGASWTQIAGVLGVSVQAAHTRYRRIRHDPATGRVWHEPPLPI